MIFRISSINIGVSGYGGSKKCGVFAGTYFHVRIICMCFIERIRFYVHGSRVLVVWKSPNCELFWLFVCMDVWSWCSKTLSFYTGFPGPCTPPHERAKNVSKRSPGVRFHGGFGRVSFWGFRGPSIRPSIHAYVRYLPWCPKTLNIYRDVRKYSLFYVCKTVFAWYLLSFLKHTN